MKLSRNDFEKLICNGRSVGAKIYSDNIDLFKEAETWEYNGNE